MAKAGQLYNQPIVPWGAPAAGFPAVAHIFAFTGHNKVVFITKKDFSFLKAGLTVVNVNPLYTARELEHQLKDSGTKAILIIENFAHTLQEVIDRTPVEHVVLTKLGDRLGTLKGSIVNFVVKYVKKMVPSFSEAHH